jgi:hypothetical protein
LNKLRAALDRRITDARDEIRARVERVGPNPFGSGKRGREVKGPRRSRGAVKT